MTMGTKILIGVLIIGVVLIGGCWFIKFGPQETTSIELFKCGELSPRYVTLPVILPVDTEAEAQIIATACLKKAIFKDPSAKTVEREDFWYLEGPKRQSLDYPFWSMTISKTTGKTEYEAVK